MSKPALDGIRRIQNEFKDAVASGMAYDWMKQRPLKKKSNSTDIILGPLASNLRDWHFSFVGSGQLYESGVYHGRILLPNDYPSSPPRIQLWTPSGRFVPFREICLSASAYHPESWTPRWTIIGLIQALRAHMSTQPQEIGAVFDASYDEIINYTEESRSWRQSWREKGSSSGNWFVVTVDHALLLEQGVLKPKAIPLDNNNGADKEKTDIDTNTTTTTPSSGNLTADDNNESDDSPMIQKAQKKSKASRKKKKTTNTSKSEVSTPAAEL